MAASKIKVIVVDDSPSFLEGIVMMVSSDERFEVIAKFNDGLDLINSEKYLSADIVLSDIEMPNMNGIEAAKLINYRRPELPLLAMTIHLDEVYLKDLLGAGYKGIVYKPDVVEELFPAMEKVLNNQLVFPKTIRTT